MISLPGDRGELGPPGQEGRRRAGGEPMERWSHRTETATGMAAVEEYALPFRLPTCTLVLLPTARGGPGLHLGP